MPIDVFGAVARFVLGRGGDENRKRGFSEQVYFDRQAAARKNLLNALKRFEYTINGFSPRETNATKYINRSASGNDITKSMAGFVNYLVPLIAGTSGNYTGQEMRELLMERELLWTNMDCTDVRLYPMNLEQGDGPGEFREVNDEVAIKHFMSEVLRAARDASQQQREAATNFYNRYIEEGPSGMPPGPLT
jgi:hypothetical protein